MKKFKSFGLVLIVALLLIAPVFFVHAQQSPLDCNTDGGCVPTDGSASISGSNNNSFGNGGLQFTNMPTDTCNPTVRNLGDVICKFGAILNSLIPLLLSLGVLYFVFGVVSYVIASDEEAKKSGRDRIIFGIIGFAVILGMWGLVTLVIRTFNLGTGGTQVVSDFITQNNRITASSGTSCNQLSASKPGITNVFDFVTCVISTSVIPLIFALASVSFVWGVVQYVINGDDEAKKTKGRDFMLWGIIALAVMVSVWGLVKILGTTFGIQTFIPTVQPPR